MLNSENFARIARAQPNFVTAKFARDKSLLHRNASSSIARHMPVPATQLFVRHFVGEANDA
jgi:hypothetical protein